jgi:hypothetical protein
MLAEIKALLTYWVRGERFCDDLWAKLLEEERIVALLQRLRVLQISKQGEHCG